MRFAVTRVPLLLLWLCIFLVLPSLTVGKCKKWCAEEVTKPWEEKCKSSKCVSCAECAIEQQIVFKVPCLQNTTTKTFRVAMMDSIVSDTRNFYKAIVQFAAAEIQSHDCISIKDQPYNLEFVGYGNDNNASVAVQHVEYANAGLDADGNVVGDIDAIVTSSPKPWVLEVADKAEVLGIPNIHTQLGNPSHFAAERLFAFGLSLPYTQYFDAPLRSGALYGLRRIVIIRSVEDEMDRDIAVSSLSLALELGYTNIGPTASWCLQYANLTRTCRLDDGRCVCGEQSFVEQQLQLPEASSFYEIDTDYFKDQLITEWGTNRVYDNLEAFFLGIIKDVRAQGADPEVVCNLVVRNARWSLISAFWKSSLSPNIFLFTPYYQTKAFSKNLTSGEYDVPVLNETHGVSFLYAAQWHESMKTKDPVFSTGSNAVSMWKNRFARDMSIRDASNVVVGVLLQIALSKYSVPLESLSLTARRSAIRIAIGNVYDDTLFGVVRFNRQNQNNGRESAVFQSIPNETGALIDRVVLPERYAVEVRQALWTWESRFGCPPGSHNTGTKCQVCPNGTYNEEKTAGMRITYCSTCITGMQPADSVTESGGSISCVSCPSGRYRSSGSALHEYESDALNGLCIDCGLGTFRNSSMTGSSCSNCGPGTFAGASGSTECDDCPRGRYIEIGELADNCTRCPLGRYQTAAGSTSCIDCPPGAECTDDSVYAKAGWYFIRGEFMQCPTIGTCLGGCAIGTCLPSSECVVGMEGPLCNSCAPGWSRISDNARCGECYDRSVHVLIVILVMFGFMTYISIMIKFTVEARKEKRPLGLIALKIVSNYLQLSSVAFRVARFELSSHMLRFLGGTSGATGDPSKVLFSLDCEDWSVGEYQFYEFRLAIVAHCLIPSAILISIAVQPLRRALALRGGAVPTMIISLFVLHPIVTEIFAKAIDCTKYDTWRLRANTMIVCGSSEQSQARLVAMLGFVIWSLGLPLVLFMVLFANRRWLLVPGVRKKFGFLCEGFEYRYYFFECILMARKVLVIFAAVAPVRQTALNMLAMVIVGIISLAVQVGCTPFDNRAYGLLNSLELRSICAFLTTALGSLIVEIHVSGDSVIESRMSVPILTIIAFAHAQFLFALLWVCIRGKFLRRVRHIQPRDSGIRESGMRSFVADFCEEFCSCGGVSVFGIGDLLVDKHGNVDLRAISFNEREFLKAALNSMIALAVNNTNILRTEQFSQLVIVAAARAMREQKGRTRLKEKLKLKYQKAMSMTESSPVMQGLRASLEELRPSLHAMVLKRITQLQQGNTKSIEEAEGIKLLSDAAQEALDECHQNHQKRPRITVEEFHAAIVCTTDDILAGNLVLDQGMDLASWTMSLAQLRSRTDADPDVTSDEGLSPDAKADIEKSLYLKSQSLNLGASEESVESEESGLYRPRGDKEESGLDKEESAGSRVSDKEESGLDRPVISERDILEDKECKVTAVSSRGNAKCLLEI